MDCGRITNSVLHWNYRGFTEFPLKRLQGEEDEITDIYLKENLISRIPSDIGKLNNLESLYLSGNDITELPREISKLTRLKCLDLSGNRLRYIPDDIGDVRNLKFLILDENELRELPLRIAELRTLRYLSVCDDTIIEIPPYYFTAWRSDNALQWLPQRPVYNYHHCEFRFWRNSSLKTIPYSLWYHMFRGQQTRSLDIGCLSQPKHQESHSARCVLQLNQYFTGCNIDLNFPTKYNHIFDKGSSFVPNLFELSKRKFYEVINESAKKLTKAPLSIYTDVYQTDNFDNSYNIRDIQESLNGFNINNNNNNGKYNSNYHRTDEIDNLILSTKRKGGCEPKDIIEEYFDYLPRFIRDDLCNGPLSRCENVRCKKPIFDFVYYEFCVEKLILIEATEDIILSAAFCSKTCAEAWKPGKAVLHWKFV